MTVQRHHLPTGSLGRTSQTSLLPLPECSRSSLASYLQGKAPQSRQSCLTCPGNKLWVTPPGLMNLCNVIGKYDTPVLNQSRQVYLISEPTHGWVEIRSAVRNFFYCATCYSRQGENGFKCDPVHSEGYLLISNVVYTNQIAFCFKHLSAEENQFQDAMAVIFQAKDPLQTY